MIRLEQKARKKELVVEKHKDIKKVIERQPLLPHSRSKLKHLEAVLEDCGLPLVYNPFFGYSEAGILSPRFDIPCVLFGPGPQDKCHESNEYANVELTIKSSEVFQRLTKKMCASS